MRRLTWLAVTVLSFAVAARAAASGPAWAWALFALGAIGPDLSMLVGVGTPVAHGQLPAIAVPYYNAVHRIVVPLALVSLGVLASVAVLTIVGAAWAGHIALDRV